MSRRKPRPRCFACDAAIRITKGWGDHPARYTGYGYQQGDPAPLFCTQRCAINFAVVHARAGHRLVGKDGGTRPGVEQ